ncbi:MAG: GntR family transcriptional regulator [Planctomycetota bacterium]|nr:GntR family transcriptional regulator [Planctomycetota bacterium]
MAKPRRGPGRPRNPKALYLGLAHAFRTAIRSGAWPLGSRVPAQRLLARRHGVSQHTIRWALDVLAREGRIAPNARRGWLVKQAPRSGLAGADYVLEALGMGFETCLRGADSCALHRGIEQGVAQLERALICLPSYRLTEHLPSPHVLAQPLAGIVLVGLLKHAVLRQYERLNVPVVLADRPGEAWNLHAIAVDNEKAAHDATKRMIAWGHRRIAFVRRLQPSLLSVDEDGRERQKGYEAACREAGLPFRPDWIFNSLSRDTAKSPWTARLLHARPAFTAVLAADASRAALVEEAAAACARKVPEDLSIVTFQGTSNPAPYAGPRFDFFELGRRAVHLLTQPRQPARHERLAFTWSSQRSLAPA